MQSRAMRETLIEQGTVIDSAGAKHYCGRAMFCFGFALSIYVCVCVYFVLRTFRRAALYNNWKVLTPAEQEQWLPYRRNDAGRLDIFPIILGGVLLVPWRVPLALFIVFSNGVWAALLTRATRAEDVWLPRNFLKIKLFRWILCVSVRLHSRILLYVFGIWRIDEHFPRNGKEEGNHLKTNARVIVSNHVSCLDIPYFIYASCAAFVSKSVLQKVPFIGDAAESLNCIFIDRESEADRNIGLQKIKGRCELLRREPDANPLVIFPEGTTTNGRCLLRFRRGAFCGFHPVQPVVLIYRCSHVDVAYELLPSLDWTLLTLSSTGLVKLEAYWLPPVDPPPAYAFNSDDERASAFASMVREAMWAELCARRCSSAGASARKCPDWTGSGKLRMQLEQILVQRQQRDVPIAPYISEEQGDTREKAL